MNPPIRWAGGKRWLVETIRPMWEAIGKPDIVEPFCGSGSVSFGLQPRKADLSDSNRWLINFYREVQKGNIHTTGGPLGLVNTPENYYTARDAFNVMVHREEYERTRIWHPSDYLYMAKLFYHLNRTCYNGVWRENKYGEMNVPCGLTSYDPKNDQTDWAGLQSAMSGWLCSSGLWGASPAIQLGKYTSRDLLVYADPPYFNGFVGYQPGGFTLAGTRQLVRALSGLPCPVILSNTDDEGVIALCKSYGFKVYRIEGRTTVSQNPLSRGVQREVLCTLNM